MRHLLLLSMLLALPLPALAQEAEEAMRALEMDFEDEMVELGYQTRKAKRLEAAAEEATGWEAVQLWDETRTATSDLFATTLSLVATAEQIRDLAYTLPAWSHGHLHQRADRMIQRTRDLAADGVVQVVGAHVRASTAYLANGDLANASYRRDEARAFVRDHADLLDTPQRHDRVLGALLDTTARHGEVRLGRDLGRQCLATCHDPAALSAARINLEAWALHLQLESRRLQTLVAQVHAAPRRSAEAMNAVDQLEASTVWYDLEERRLLVDPLPVAQLQLVAADKGWRTRHWDQRERAWSMAGQHTSDRRFAREARAIERRAGRTPMAWTTLRLGYPHEAAPEGADPAFRLSAGLGLSVLPAPWLQLEARLTQEVPITGEIWTGRAEGLVGLDPLAKPAFWTWRRAALRPLAGGGLVWGTGSERGHSLRAGLQVESMVRTWRRDSGLRVMGLELDWTRTVLGEQSWSAGVVEVYVGWGGGL